MALNLIATCMNDEFPVIVTNSIYLHLIPNIISHFLILTLSYLYVIRNLSEQRKKIIADKRALASMQTTPSSKGDTSLTRSLSSSSKVKRRSRSKSPFRSFRWKRSSTTNENGDEDGEDEGICF